MRVRRTNLASISVTVASYQTDLRSRHSGKDPWHTDGQGSGVGRAQLSRFPPHTKDKALGMGSANWGGPGGRR